MFYTKFFAPVIREKVEFFITGKAPSIPEIGKKQKEPFLSTTCFTRNSN